MNKVKEIRNYGQSIWLDFFDREIMDNGLLKKLIEEDGLSGITSNPSIFEKAVTSSADYDEYIRKTSAGQRSNEEIFIGFAVSDIRRAADMLKPVYDREKGTDGFVSLEVSPELANNTEGTIKQAMNLWNEVNRKNVMIKIPGTQEGLPAIRRCITEGANINITLLFGLDRYKEVAEAYISGLEDRLKNGHSIDHVASVASFFLSRIDVAIDPIISEKKLDRLVGEVAISSAKKAYEIYKDVFFNDRFKSLEKKGAKKQKLLWASTSTKNPSFSDVKYVNANLLWTKEDSTRAFNRPKPTKQKKDTSAPQRDHPQEANKALAISRYNELEKMRMSGEIDENTYQQELDKILPLIDISKDLAG